MYLRCLYSMAYVIVYQQVGARARACDERPCGATVVCLFVCLCVCLFVCLYVWARETYYRYIISILVYNIGYRCVGILCISLLMYMSLWMYA